MPAHLAAGQLSILRALADFRHKRHRWPSCYEVTQEAQRSLLSARWLLGKLIRSGLVAVDVKPLVHTRYGLTDKGRAAIGAGAQLGLMEEP